MCVHKKSRRQGSNADEMLLDKPSASSKVMKPYVLQYTKTYSDALSHTYTYTYFTKFTGVGMGAF